MSGILFLLVVLGFSGAAISCAEEPISVRTEPPPGNPVNLIGNPGFEGAGYHVLELAPGAQNLAAVHGAPAGVILNQLGKGKVIFWELDEGSRHSLLSHNERFFLNCLNYLLEGQRPLTLKKQNAGENIDVSMREKSDTDKTLFLVNREKKEVSFTLGIDMPPGGYQVESMVIPFGTEKNISDGKSFSADELKGLEFKLPAQTVEVIHFRPVGEPDPAPVGETFPPEFTRGVYACGMKELSQNVEELAMVLKSLHANAVTSFIRRDETPALKEYDYISPAKRILRQNGISLYCCMDYGHILRGYIESQATALAILAKTEIDAIGLVPDEWVANFDKTDICKTYWGEKFEEKYGCRPDETDPRRWMQFCLEESAAVAGKWADAVRNIRKDAFLHSTLSAHGTGRREVVMTDWNLVSRAAGLDSTGTDPYVILHNTMWCNEMRYYVRETVKHLVASNPYKRAAVVLQGSTLRAYQRQLRPIESYGNALSAIGHGANEIFYFTLDCIIGRTSFVNDYKAHRRWVTEAFTTIEEIEPWISKSHTPRKTALLYSSRSSDYAPGKIGMWAQKKILYSLLENGYPFDICYLDTLEKGDLDEYKVVILPFPYQISQKEIDILKECASEGTSFLVLGNLGIEDEDFRLYTKPPLSEFCGIKDLKEYADGPLEFTAGSPVRGEIISPDPGSWPTKLENISTDTAHSGTHSLKLKSSKQAPQLIACSAVDAELGTIASLPLEQKQGWHEYSVVCTVPEKTYYLKVGISGGPFQVILPGPQAPLLQDGKYRFGVWTKFDGENLYFDDFSLTPVEHGGEDAF